jgi:signal transduction histidine kinase
LSSRKNRPLGISFGDLRIRTKLIVLHNLFFLVLTIGVYFSLIPLFEKVVADARAREVSMLRPGRTRLAQQSYDDTVFRARVTLFLILGAVYGLAVLSLEAALIPRYVFRPLSRMLEADAATQAGDRAHEIIPPEEITGDEIGQIMRSRNAAVSALRRREDELAAALRRLEEQDRLVSLGLLSASVAHELNTPLAVLAGSIEKMTETTQDAPSLDRLRRMQRVTERLRRISESLVDFSRIRQRKMEPTAIRPLVEEAWSLVAIDEKAAHVEFINAVPPEHQVVGSSDRLLQVFVNLLRNALNAVVANENIAKENDVDGDEANGNVAKRNDAKGEVGKRDVGKRDVAKGDVAKGNVAKGDVAKGDVAKGDAGKGDIAKGDLAKENDAKGNIAKGNDVKGNEAHGRIEVHSRPLTPSGTMPQNTPPTLSITVEDNGPGIPPEVLPGIFDAFVTTRLDAHGTGLGLTVTEGIITQHGGTISASNRPQGGACLEVVLPAA